MSKRIAPKPGHTWSGPGRLYDHVPVDAAAVDAATHQALAETPWLLEIAGVSLGIYADKLTPQKIIASTRGNGHDTSTAIIRLATFEEVRPGIEYAHKTAEYWHAYRERTEAQARRRSR